MIVYTDLHIHSSENADDLNSDYDVRLLVEKVKRFSNHDNNLISITDHNTINKIVYEQLLSEDISILLGVELHIRNYKEMKPYHCHMYFDISKDEILENIDNINIKLDRLYPKKMVSREDKIPSLEDVAKVLDDYNYLMLPHGGQSHGAFHKTIPSGRVFDTVMERNIYYNQFDGFTSRSTIGLRITKDYFEQLGILSFINLITCTDNYNPLKYPNTKSPTAGEFIPTWIRSEATFSGLRLALSESSRLFYQRELPKTNQEYIKSVKLKNESIDIDVKLTTGLNVIIGGSSSGKTLFMDSLYNKLFNDFETSNYLKYGVEDIQIVNPMDYKPHYISQNYITKVMDDDSDLGLESIDIIKNTFVGNITLDRNVEQTLLSLQETIVDFVNSIAKIESLQSRLSRIPSFPNIIQKDSLESNPYEMLLPSEGDKAKIKFEKIDLDKNIDALEEIKRLSIENPYIDDLTTEIDFLIDKLTRGHKMYELSVEINSLINNKKSEFDRKHSEGKTSELVKKNNRENLVKYTRKYIEALDSFYINLEILKDFDFDYSSEKIESNGHILFIENKFKLDKDVLISAINHHLKKANQIISLDDIQPNSLFEINFSKKQPKVNDYKDFRTRLYNWLSKDNNKIYRITDKNGKDINDLSPGWRTAVILDIVLGYKSDIAPILIDQPEDNLATNYINNGLVDSIKSSKNERQIIIISHNATIPMLADAQNIIHCENIDGVIKIRSSSMEGKLNDRDVIDYIAEITDGGKASVKKRVKKYNLKTFREDKDK